MIETDRPTTAPGAERILHLGTTLEVFLAELRPTPGRLQATVRATIAVMVGVVLAAMVGDPAFVMCPVTAMTESTPGTVHSPGLLARRVLLSFLCAGASIVIVAAFPQAQPVLYVAILLLVWGVLYLARVLPVGSSGLRVAIWTLGITFSVPLENPANFERNALLSALGVSMGVLISHAATLLIFPGAESLRARQAVDGLLFDAARKLRALATACRGHGAIASEDALADASTLAHIAVLTDAVRTYVEPGASFPELTPLTRMACIADSATVHLIGLAHTAAADTGAREAAAHVAVRMADLLDRTRGLSFERHWARPGDLVPELDALAREAETLIEEGDRIIREASDSTEETTLSIAGFARRVGGSLRATLTDRPLPAGLGTSALALPLGFAPAGPTGRAPTLVAALSRFDPVAATSAAACTSGLALAMLLTAFLLPAETSAAAIGSVFLMQSTIGGSGRRGLLRFVGTVIGGAMAIVAMAFFAGGLQGLEWYLVIVGAMTFASAWVFVGSPRTNYAGLMMAAAWITAIIVDPAPAVTVTPALARIASVVLAGLCVTAMIWLYATTSARVALMRSIADGWKRLADLMRTATMKPVHPGDLDAWRRASHLATGNLAATADLREQYAFERRLRNNAFQPVLRTLAEQQRALLLARAMAIGRFHDHPLPVQATAALDRALEAQARRLDRLSERYLRPDEGEPIATELPTAHATRTTAIEAGCTAEDVARLVYRRDAIEMLARTIDRAERLAATGFVWVDGKLESVLELDAIEAGARQPAAMLAATP